MAASKTINGQDVRKAKLALSAVACGLLWAWLLLAICVPAVLRAVHLADAQGWSVATATVAAAGADEACSRNGTHAFRVQYDYDVDGRHFRGDRFEMFGPNCYPDSRIAELSRQMPAGSTVQIRFNPQSPGQSAISVDGDHALARSQALADTVFLVVYSALAFACLRFAQVRTRLAVT